MTKFFEGAQMPDEKRHELMEEVLKTPLYTLSDKYPLNFKEQEVAQNSYTELPKKTYEELENELIETRTLFFSNMGRVVEAESKVFSLEQDLKHKELFDNLKIKDLEREVEMYKQLAEIYSDKCTELEYKCEKLEKRTLFDYLFR